MTETTKERKARKRKNLKRKRKRLHRQWKSYLGDSRLTPEEQKRRAIFSRADVKKFRKSEHEN